jgi:signal transduction histidine kinase/DNA-binding response OmpR family regulator
MTLVSIIMLLSITSDASRTHARFYSMETVEILSSYLSKEITFVQYAAHSKEMIDWFADEDNQEKKTSAYQEMMNYTNLLQTRSLYFAILESLNEYSIKSDEGFKNFIPFDKLNPNNLYDQWFFNCVNSKNDYILNMDLDKVTNTRCLWINQKVMEDGVVRGVFCSALQLDELFYALFRQYDNRTVMGYIVDHNGFILIDSSVSEPSLLYEGITIDEVKEQLHIKDISSNSEFTSVINAHLRNLGANYSAIRVDPKVLKISGGNYQYSSVAPIPATNWIVVTFYNADSLFNIRSLLPLLFVVLSAFIIYSLFNSTLIRQLFISPLNRLIHSISNVGGENNNIYGTDHDDEIGELARATQKTWNRLIEYNTGLLKAMDENNHRDHMLQAINTVAAILLDSDISQFERSLYRCMGMMAAAVDADCVHLWKNNQYQGELCATKIYEWSEHAGQEQAVEFTANVSYREKIPQWEDTLSKGQCINSLAHDIPDFWKNVSPAGILSIFIAPVFLQDQFWGFVGFDNCHRGTQFTENEEAILRSGCLMIASALLRHNNITEIVSLQKNLEEALKEARAASQAKSIFLAHMSHEIRTPMNSILGFSELAIDDNIPVKTKDYLHKIIESTQGLLQIINDVLDISKIESGKMELENIPFDINELFANCKTILMQRAEEKGLTLNFYVEQITGKKTLSDPTRLRQILLNLLSNAIKFTNTGTVEIHAKIKEIKEESIAVYFEITDTGIGMTSEQIVKVFDPFIQAESSTTRKYGGTGLGLTITKNIIELLGGKLSVESTPGAGSKFSFDLIFDTIDAHGDEKFNQTIVLDEIKKPTFEGEVLLCEDNTINQQVISEHLARVGLKTVIAENGKIGVDKVYERIQKNEKQFDLILMDIYMPVMDGLDASAKIIEFNINVPIIAITANVMASEREIYKQKGLYDCVGKPFTSQELWRCLLKYLKPVSHKESTSTEEDILLEADLEFQKTFRVFFVKNYQNKFDELTNALETGDIEHAHRITHNIKGNAAQLGKTILQKAAADAERRLKDGKNLVTEEQLKTLKDELNAVLIELSPLLN